jgi:hypothetical protein
VRALLDRWLERDDDWALFNLPAKGGYGVMRTIGVCASLNLPELAMTRFAVGARRRPAPPEKAGAVLTDTTEQPHADAKGESVAWRLANVKPTSAVATVRKFRIFVFMVCVLRPLIWLPPACRRSGHRPARSANRQS